MSNLREMRNNWQANTAGSPTSEAVAVAETAVLAAKKNEEKKQRLKTLVTLL